MPRNICDCKRLIPESLCSFGSNKQPYTLLPNLHSMRYRQMVAALKQNLEENQKRLRQYHVVSPEERVRIAMVRQ